MVTSRRSAWLLSMLVLAMALLTTAVAQAGQDPASPNPPRIGIITMEPGGQFWERFGHDSILVIDPVTGGATSYNFGAFDMSEPGFVGNFIRGRMWYSLIALPLRHDLASYEAEGRGASVQWLALEPGQAIKLANALEINARPENARYRYDYYVDNCSTRVRDAIDLALDGKLKEQLIGRSQGNTYRSESVRLAWPAKWMAFGFHLGMSGYGDRPLTRWEEAFIPMRLRDSLREVKLADGRPLVLSEQPLLSHRLSMPPEEMPTWRMPALFTGLALALMISWLGRRVPRLLALIAFPFWLLAGLTGSLMIYLWLGTAHVAAHANQNILLFSPLCLLLLPGAWRAMRTRGMQPDAAAGGPGTIPVQPGSSRFGFLLWAVAGSAAIAGFLKFLPFLSQENVEWVLLLLPVHLALARTFSPKT